MLQVVGAQRARTVEFGIYRDGDNNLDESQSEVVAQAIDVSNADRRIQFTVENTDAGDDGMPTDLFTIQDGDTTGPDYLSGRNNMASESNLAEFVAHTLDNAEKCGATQTWIDLVDHGAGDGGGLEADSFGRQIMPMPQMAQAIADGIKLHEEAHPEDTGRTVDGVVANQCLMASLGFADALSHAGVKFLAASPETMVSPGVPSSVAHDIAASNGNVVNMARSIVKDAMNYRDGVGKYAYGTAAAFDVIDTSRSAMAPVETSVRALNDAIAASKGDARVIGALRDDALRVDGMVRFPEATPDMPWHADRPAIALYDKIAADTRLTAAIRSAAVAAEAAVKKIVIAHKESSHFEPFGGTSYTDAIGPTVHFPVSARQIDPWAPKISETKNRFFNETDAAAAERVVA